MNFSFYEYLQNILKTSLPSTESEHQAPVFTVAIDYEEFVLSQSWFSSLPQNVTSFSEFKISSLGSNSSLNLIPFQEASSKPQLLKNTQNFSKKEIPCTDSSKNSKKKCNILTDTASLTSNVIPTALKPTSKHDINKDDSSTSQLEFQFKTQLTAL